MIRPAEWRICLAAGAALGLAGAPFWDPGEGWPQAVLALALVTTVVVERGRAGWMGVVAIAAAALVAGSLVGAARIDAIDSGGQGPVDRAEPERNGPALLIDRLHDRADVALGRAVPDREAALSRGFVLGDDEGIDKRTVDDFRASGLSHLLAVSGQNIVLLSLLAIPFLSLLGFGPRARLVAIAVLIVIYVPLAGGGPSIQRAGVMGIAGLVAAGATRAPSRVFALAVAAAITLLIDPRATGDIGWQLSFAAVAGIMILAGPFADRIGSLIGRNGWRGALVEGLAVTLAATIATAPLSVLHFERFPIGTLPANLIAMPAVAPAMWLGMVSIAVGQVSPTLAVPFNLAGSVFLAWIARVAEWFGRPAGASPEVRLDTPELIVASLLLAGAVAAVLKVWRVDHSRKGRSKGVAGILVAVAIVSVLVPWLIGGDRRHLGEPAPGGARVEVLDVGQGDAILVRPWGTDPILIDGGPPGGDLIGALESADVDRLEAVILTHPDLDHYGGLMELFGHLPAGRLLFDRAPPELIALAGSSGVALERVAEGDTIRNGDVRLELLWPPADDGPAAQSAGADAETNARSIVALLEWRGFRMLLTGDAEAETVPMDPGPLDVLKVSHHGSEDTGLPALLDRTLPTLSVISAGSDNSYGHPVPDVLQALDERHVETLRTDLDGTVSIVLGDGGPYLVETGR